MSIFKTVFNAIISVIKAVKGSVKVTDVLVDLAAKLPMLIINAVKLLSGDKKDKIDEALQGWDELTGNDEGALDLIHDLPADKEEEAADHLKEFIRIVAYCEAKVPGYFEGDPDGE